MDIKKFFRGVALYLLGAGLVFLLFVLAYVLVFTQVTAKPEKMKQILSNSGIYRKIPSVVYDNSVQSGATSSESIPLKDSAVRQAALDTFSPDFIQKNVETIIDGTYGWLKGKTDQPQFNIDLKEAKNRFAVSLSDQAAERLKHLPACTAAQQQKIKEVDPLSVPCLPAGTDIEAMKKKVLASVAGSDNFLKDTTIDPKTFKDNSGKPLFNNYSEVPHAYQTALKLPYVLGALCLMFAAAIVFLSEKRSKGFKKLGKTLTVAGIFVILAPIGLSFISGNLLKSAPDDKVLTDLVGPVITQLNKATSQVYFIMSILYILLACGAFFAYRKMRELPEPAVEKPTEEKKD